MRRKLAWIVAVAGKGVLLLALLCGIVNASLGDRPMPAPALPSGFKSKYRVAVLGDSQKGLANLANLLRTVKKEGVEFVLQTGDLVSNNDEGHYRLVALALSRAGLGVPFVAVPGNHDVKGSPDRFRRELGDLERSFRVGEISFATIDNASGAPPDPARLKEAAVLAMHVPPFDAEGRVQKGYEPFLAWLEKSRVQYLLCGHVHGYFKKRVGRTTVLVNGVGGDYDRWQLDQKVYATILEVDGATVTDRAIELPPEHGLRSNLEHLAIGHVAEAYRRHPVLCWGATLLLAAAVGFSIGVIRLKP